MNRTGLLLCVLLLGGWNAAIGAEPATKPVNAIDPQAIQRAEERGVRWLLTQQAADGGWHSRSYGLMSNGAGNTALCLRVLASRAKNGAPAEKQAFERGVTFLTKFQHADGLVRSRDGAADFPVYATALLLIALHHGAAADDQLLQRLREGLLRAQRTTANGWRGVATDVGGWGPNVWTATEGESPVPANVSVTRYVLEALTLTGTLPPKCRAGALEFLGRLQSDRTHSEAAGGFAFTPQFDHPLNKGPKLEKAASELFARPYHSATCDGVLALWACGLRPDDERMRDAMTALLKLPPHEFLSPEQVREPDATPPALTTSLAFYDAAATAQVWRTLREERFSGFRSATIRTLLARQQPDGTWTNPVTWMREDDPLLATALAVLAVED